MGPWTPPRVETHPFSKPRPAVATRRAPEGQKASNLDARTSAWIFHASRIPTSPSQSSHFREAYRPSGIVGQLSLLAYGRAVSVAQPILNRAGEILIERADCFEGDRGSAGGGERKEVGEQEQADKEEEDEEESGAGRRHASDPRGSPVC